MLSMLLPLLPLLPLLLLACGADPDGGPAPCEQQVWHADSDGDGFGEAADTLACDQPPGTVDNALDCDDGDASVHPDAEELCDGVDNDCDGVRDPPDTLWYVDADGDGWGGTGTVQDCAQPEGAVAEGGDCDDSDPSVSPGAAEIWYDGFDQDCAGDDDFDADGDGYASQDEDPEGTDCNDGSVSVHPGAEDACEDGIDQDCSGADSSCGPEGEIAARSAALVVEAPEPSTSLGLGLFAAGDTNGDGVEELWVGAPGWDEGLDEDVGAFFLIDGTQRGTVTPTVASTAVMRGVNAGDYMGEGAVAADIDGDGYDDALLAALGWKDDTYDQGVVYLVHGPFDAESSCLDASGEWRGVGPDEELGWRIGLLDVDGDHRWLALDAPQADIGKRDQSNGFIYLFEPVDGPPLTSDDASVVLYSEYNYAYLGFDFDTGDVDGDGVDDIVAGVVREEITGIESKEAYSSVVVFEGPFEDGETRSLADVDAARSNGVEDYLGYALDLVDDLDGDGQADVVAGAYLSESDGLVLGQVFVLTGPLSGRSRIEDGVARFIASEDDSGFGYDVSGEGDLNDDGQRDLVVGAAVSTNAGGDRYAGRAHLFYGPFEGVREAADADATWNGNDENDQLGLTLVSGPDLDGDGIDDLVLGTWVWPDWTFRGAVYLFPGGPQER